MTERSLGKMDPLRFDNFVKRLPPVKTGGQGICEFLKILDSGFRRNDGIRNFVTL
jgi:hypothetical protein